MDDKSVEIVETFDLIQAMFWELETDATKRDQADMPWDIYARGQVKRARIRLKSGTIRQKARFIRLDAEQLIRNAIETRAKSKRLREKSAYIWANRNSHISPNDNNANNAQETI